MISTEELMDDAVFAADGQRVDQLLQPNEPQRRENADYVFRSDNAIAELKSLQQEVFTPAYHAKLSRLAHSWRDRRLIRVFGRAKLELRRLPAACQLEWLRLLTLPLQTKVIAKANRQIERTKKQVNLPDAKGIVLLANDGNSSFEPYNLVVLVSQILKKMHPDGSPQYSSIHAVSFLSANLPISSPALPTPAFWWLNGHRPSSTEKVSKLLQKLETAWYAQLSRRVGYEIPRVLLREDALENLSFLN